MSRITGIVVLLLGCFTAGEVAAQTGAWVSRPLPDFGTGDQRYVSGGKCAAFSFQRTMGFLFFDTGAGDWSELDLAAPRDVVDLRAAGDLVLAVTDSLLIAYNARTAAAHQIAYGGEILFNTTSLKSWGCSGSLAYLLTDQQLYVFDAATDSWAAHTHGWPPVMPGYAELCVKDDYVAAQVITDYDEPRRLVVYSGVTHSFNQHDRGLKSFISGDFFLDHGLAGVGRSESLDEDWILGYSALSNQFDYHEVDTDGSAMSATGGLRSDIGPQTCVMAKFVTGVQGSPFQVHMFAYDTMDGQWRTGIFSYNSSNQGVGQTLWRGGRVAGFGLFAWDQQDPLEPYTVGAEVFDGLSGTFAAHNTIAPEYTGGDYLLLGGGTTFGYGGMDLFNGFDVRQGVGLPQVLTGDGYVDSHAGEAFFAFARYTEGASRMDTYIFNGRTTRWTTVDMPVSLHQIMSGGSSVLAMACGTPTAETLFYSPLLDTYSLVSLPDGQDVQTRHSATLALAFNPGEGYLYDAATGVAHHRVGQFTTSSLGEHVCLMAVDDHTLAGYGAISGSWTLLDAGQSVSFQYAGNYLGWAETVPALDRIYVFNSIHDSWLPLEVAGPGWHVANGERTMLVVDRNSVSAFDPQGDATPVFLADFTLRSDRELVVARWRTSRSCAPTDFRLTARAGGRTWPVPVRRDPEEGFRGEDHPVAVSVGTHVLYELRWQRPGEEPELLAAEEITLLPPLPRVILRGAYPNPCNPATTARFILDRRRTVDLGVFDLAGRRVATIANGAFDRGEHEVAWRGIDTSGRPVASGTYLLRLQADGMIRSTKLVLAR